VAQPEAGPRVIRTLTIGQSHCTLRRVKLTPWGVWVLLMTLPACGTSDPKNSASGGSANQNQGGFAAETDGSDSSGGGEESLGGQANAGGTGGSSTTGGKGGGASEHAGSGGSGVTGGRSGDAPPDIDASTLTSNLSDDEKAALCDWQAGTLGAYGHVSQCGMGTRTFFPDQASCVAMAFEPYCAKATAGQFIDCVSSVIPSNGCNSTAECRRLFCM